MRILRVASLQVVALLVALAPAGVVNAAPAEIPLPTTIDALTLGRANPLELLPLGGGGRHVPADVTDTEAVFVTVTPDGTPAAIAVEQRLQLHGLGDFVFTVPARGSSVRPLPESDNPPGFRDGAVVWQGFSPGEKTLACLVELDPRTEAGRLPVAFRLSSSVGGAAVPVGGRATGRLSVALRITNSTPTAIPVHRGTPSADVVAPLLDDVRASLRSGRLPAPGEGALPLTLPASEALPDAMRTIESPMRVRGRIEFPAGTVDDIHVDGGTARRSSAGLRVTFDRVLGGGEPLEATVRVTATVTDAAAPTFAATATPVLPSPSVVEPPTGATWTDAVRADPSLDGSRLFDVLTETLWIVARTTAYDQFLGNPNPLDESRTVYRYAVGERPAAAPPPRPPLEVVAVKPLGVVALAVCVLLVLGLGAAVWSRS